MRRVCRGLSVWGPGKERKPGVGGQRPSLQGGCRLPVEGVFLWGSLPGKRRARRTQSHVGDLRGLSMDAGSRGQYVDAGGDRPAARRLGDGVQGRGVGWRLRPDGLRISGEFAGSIAAAQRISTWAYRSTGQGTVDRRSISGSPYTVGG